MTGERRSQILGRLSDGSSSQPQAARLCRVSAEVTGSSGAGIMLMSGDVPQGTACCSDDVAELIERLQFDLGEGPCIDAYQQDRPVMEPDLVTPMVPRWLAFSGAAIDAGVRAVFGFPLRVGAVRLGALNLYRTVPGFMTDEHHASALVMAEIAAESMLGMQAEAARGRLAASIEAAGDFPYIVHQASGMVAAQLEINVAQALIRLRAFSFGNDRPLREVAAAVVDRRLRFVGLDGEVEESDTEESDTEEDTR